MKGIFIAVCVLTLVTFPVLFATANEINTIDGGSNVPIITGPTEGIHGEVYNYQITYSDPNGDDVYYEIAWGDCAIICNAGPFKSGEVVTFSHAWCSFCTGPGTFTIKVMGFDGNGDNSNWGTLSVHMRSRVKWFNNQGIYHLFENLIERFPILENLFKF